MRWKPRHRRTSRVYSCSMNWRRDGRFLQSSLLWLCRWCGSRSLRQFACCRFVPPLRGSTDHRHLSQGCACGLPWAIFVAPGWGARPCADRVRRQAGGILQQAVTSFSSKKRSFSKRTSFSSKKNAATGELRMRRFLFLMYLVQDAVRRSWTGRSTLQPTRTRRYLQYCAGAERYRATASQSASGRWNPACR